MARATAAFHLDRLVEEGLLDVVHRRISGPSGPAAERPVKLYLRSEHEVEVSPPQRRYELIGEVLAAALEGSRHPLPGMPGRQGAALPAPPAATTPSPCWSPRASSRGC